MWSNLPGGIGGGGGGGEGGGSIGIGGGDGGGGEISLLPEKMSKSESAHRQGLRQIRM